MRLRRHIRVARRRTIREFQRARDERGAILNECSNFGVNAYSPPNFLAFNRTLTYTAGGVPKTPELILVGPNRSTVTFYASGGARSGYPLGIVALGPSGVIGMQTITTASTWAPSYGHRDGDQPPLPWSATLIGWWLITFRRSNRFGTFVTGTIAASLVLAGLPAPRRFPAGLANRGLAGDGSANRRLPCRVRKSVATKLVGRIEASAQLEQRRRPVGLP